MTHESILDLPLNRADLSRLEELIKPLHQLLDLLERPEDDREGLGDKLLAILTQHQDSLTALAGSVTKLEEQNTEISETVRSLSSSMTRTENRLNILWQLLNGPPAAQSED